jgi:hypothetical protein
MQAFEDAGIELDVIARGIGAGAAPTRWPAISRVDRPGIGTWRLAPV